MALRIRGSWLLIGLSLSFLTLFLFFPLAVIIVQAFEQGWQALVQAWSDADTLAALRLTLITVGVVVPVNLVFGVAAAWCLAKFEFAGKGFIVSLIDLPLAVSPVIAGLIYVLIFGRHGWLGPWCASHGFRVIFAVPGVILATVFVTSPFIARELIFLMHAHGTHEEEAAISLGARGWKVFWQVTFPNIKWGLLYGVTLCSARAIGEFGAVSVVSGHIRGETNTLPLQIEILYNEYQFAAAFAIAMGLALVAVVTLILKSSIRRNMEHATRRGRAHP